MSDPTMPADPSDDGADDSQGTTVCITALPDGTFSVQIQESGDDESGESGEDESGDGPQSADNLDDALKLAGQMLTAEMGEESGESADGSDGSDDGNAPLAPGAAKSAWNAMASKRDQSRTMG